MPRDLEAALRAVSGEVELRVPAASAVKIDGERAYRLHRRGVAVEMPVRRSSVHGLSLRKVSGPEIEVELHVGSGTYVRSIADALGGHCVTLRRTAVGPFSLDDADETTVLAPREALPFLPEVEVGRRRGVLLAKRPAHRARGRGLRATRSRWAARRRRPARRGRRAAGDGAAVKVARHPHELPPAERAVAIGTFDGVHRGHRAVLDAAIATGLPSCVVTFDPHPREVLGYAVQLLSTFDRRLELIAEAGADEVLAVEFTPELARRSPEEFVATCLEPIGAKVILAGEDFRFGRGRSGDVEVLRQLGFDVAAGRARRGSLLEPDPCRSARR